MLNVLIYADRQGEPLRRLLWCLASDRPAPEFTLTVLDRTPSGDPELGVALAKYAAEFRGAVVRRDPPPATDGQWLVLPASAWPTQGALAEAVTNSPRLIRCVDGGLWASLLASDGLPHPMVVRSGRPLRSMGWCGDSPTDPPDAPETEGPVVIWPPVEADRTPPAYFLTSPRVEFRLAISREGLLVVDTDLYQQPVACNQDAFRRHLLAVDGFSWAPTDDGEPGEHYWKMRSHAEAAWSAAEAGRWEAMGKALDKSWQLERDLAGCGGECDLRYASAKLAGAWGGRPTPGGLILLANMTDHPAVLESLK